MKTNYSFLFPSSLSVPYCLVEMLIFFNFFFGGGGGGRRAKSVLLQTFV